MSKIPLSEYPRMIMKRDSYMSLNGAWEYAFQDSATPPTVYEGQIIVPFSPESPLSKVNRTLKPEEYLIYRRFFNIDKVFIKDHTFIHFGAVDQAARIIVNGVMVQDFDFSVGGYHPFTIDISHVVREENEIIVIVQDLSDTSYHARGKQKFKRGQIWYTPQSGIFLPVWLESVHADFVKELKITPIYDKREVEIIVVSESSIDAIIHFDGKEYHTPVNVPFYLKLSTFISWSPSTPHLYPFEVKLGSDAVTSYFAMRKISVAQDSNGIKRIFLNNAPLFQSGLLDQGYYHEGYLTPPDDETLANDILLAKKMGFNVLRKHIKIEWERFYYHCDRLGMMVWQDFVNGGAPYKFLTINVPAVLNIQFKDNKYKMFGRNNEEGRNDFYLQSERTIKKLYNYPSIVLWTVFNEGWGQFDAKKLLTFVKELDNTRLIDIVSGWHDQGIGDLKSDHVYFRKYRVKKDKLNRCLVLSEFGGYSHKIENHYFGSGDFGYKKFHSKSTLTEAFVNLYETQIIPAVKKGLSAAIYTQLSDVEDELNGLITYDRRVIKIDVDVVKAINDKLFTL